MEDRMNEKKNYHSPGCLQNCNNFIIGTSTSSLGELLYYFARILMRQNICGCRSFYVIQIRNRPFVAEIKRVFSSRCSKTNWRENCEESFLMAHVIIINICRTRNKYNFQFDCARLHTGGMHPIAMSITILLFVLIKWKRKKKYNQLSLDRTITRHHTTHKNDCNATWFLFPGIQTRNVWHLPQAYCIAREYESLRSCSRARCTGKYRQSIFGDKLLY